MFRAHRAHHQERQIVSIQPLVTVTLCRWSCRVQVGRRSPVTDYPATRRHIPAEWKPQFNTMPGFFVMHFVSDSTGESFISYIVWRDPRPSALALERCHMIYKRSWTSPWTVMVQLQPCCMEGRKQSQSDKAWLSSWLTRFNDVLSNTFVGAVKLVYKRGLDGEMFWLLVNILGHFSRPYYKLHTYW
jgi:hypothetical protein